MKNFSSADGPGSVLGGMVHLSLRVKLGPFKVINQVFLPYHMSPHTHSAIVGPFVKESF